MPPVGFCVNKEMICVGRIRSPIDDLQSRDVSRGNKQHRALYLLVALRSPSSRPSLYILTELPDSSIHHLTGCSMMILSFRFGVSAPCVCVINDDRSISSGSSSISVGRGRSRCLSAALTFWCCFFPRYTPPKYHSELFSWNHYTSTQIVFKRNLCGPKVIYSRPPAVLVTSL